MNIAGGIACYIKSLRFPGLRQTSHNLPFVNHGGGKEGTLAVRSTHPTFRMRVCLDLAGSSRDRASVAYRFPSPHTRDTARQCPFQRFAKFSTDHEQDFCPGFVASVLDGRQMTLANTDSIGKIRLCNVKPSHAPNPATDCSPVGCTRLRKRQRKGLNTQWNET